MLGSITRFQSPPIITLLICVSWQLDSKEKGGKVTIEMVSNWGHPSRLGLTEIQLLNESEHLLPVSSSGVFVHGAESMSGSPSILFNGKTKVFCVEI